MKYVIVTIEWCLSHGIAIPGHARKSVDGSKVILHEGYVKPVLGARETLTAYMHNSDELAAIMDSEEWTEVETVSSK